MSKVVSINNRQEIADTAGLWLARLERGLSPQEREEIESWLAEDPTHGEALTELAYVWDDMGVLEELSDLFPLPPPVPEKQEQEQSSTFGWPAPRKAAYAFAGLLLVVVSSFGLLQLESFDEQPDSAQQLAQPATNPDSGSEKVPSPLTDIYETAVGEQSKVNLPDGSVATLNTGTRIKVSYGPNERKVRLERGEGYFEVAKDWDRPFIVQVERNLVQAVGTAFNVDYSHTNQLEVTVTEGKVKLVSRKKLGKILLSGSLSEESLISSGHSATVAQSDEHRLKSVSEQEIATKLAWQQGMIIFEREPLKMALEELSRYTLTEFVLADPAMEEILVGGYFKSGDIEGLLLALKENFNIDSNKDAAGRIILTAR